MTDWKTILLQICLWRCSVTDCDRFRLFLLLTSALSVSDWLLQAGPERQQEPHGHQLRRVPLQRLHRQQERGPQLQLGAGVQSEAGPVEDLVPARPQKIRGQTGPYSGACGLHLCCAQVQQVISLIIHLHYWEGSPSCCCYCFIIITLITPLTIPQISHVLS